APRMTRGGADRLLRARAPAARPLNCYPVERPLNAIAPIRHARAAGLDHRWSLDLPEEGIEIEADEARIRQILINLLGNARKHTPDGTEVVAAVRPQGDGALLQVRDNGPGIPAALVPHIFERFTRGDAARTRTEGSTGLGLSIVSAVVAAHHGTVDVTSRPGETVFSIWLPRRQPTPPAKAPAPTAPHDPRVPV
ncbi:sensor histidine kinase, partial [Flexivirga sp.]|uniref:sensor histidine kinase n=1 Tax=Flexivirga sp. TaxID=1962927 RepID=UPI003F7F2683